MVEIDNILDVEKYIDDVDVVIFDLDDTLYSEKEYVRSGYQAIADSFSYINGMTEKLWRVFENGGKAIDEVFAVEGLVDFKDEAVRIYRSHQPNIHLYPGVSEMLANIKEVGKRIGIITDGRPEGQRAKIDALKIKVDKIIITDELGGVEYRKPNEKAFHLTQEYFDVPFERMVYVGDNIKKDFIAPDRLGMKQIFFRNEDGLYSI